MVYCYGVPREGGVITESLTVKALTENIDSVTAFVDGILENSGCPIRVQMKVDIAIDELFSNVARYGYPGRDAGDVTVEAEVTEQPEGKMLSLTFADDGIPYNPLTREEPDVTLSAEERGIGGLGIFVVRKTMDTVTYEYLDGKNRLTVTKSFS